MFQKRINKLREKMKNNSIDAFLIIGDENRNYLSGFTGNESFSLITLEEAFFITDSRYVEQAKLQVKGYSILEYIGKIIPYICEIVNSKNIKTLAIEEEVMRVSFYEDISAIFKGKIIKGEELLNDLRIIKDREEIDKIKKAASIADEGFNHILNFIKEGMTEKEIAIELEFFMRKRGAESLSFETIAASGYRSALPHGAASDKKIESGEFLTLDYGCIYEGYCSDMTRTIVIGEPTEKMILIYDIVLEAQNRALNAIKDGAICKDVDRVARDYIKKSGFGDYFGHGLGHGVGREIHEAPRVSKIGETVLKSGMVITDEPGIYLPNEFGVRIEDLVLVTEEGFEVLSTSPKELICL